MRLFKQVGLSAVLAAILLPAGSAAQTAVSPAPQATPPAGITVTDARPKPETTEWMGWLSTDCDTGIRRIGDEKPTTSRLKVLQADLREAFGDKYADASLLVTKYSIFVNMSLKIQAANPGAGSLLGSVLIANGCTKEGTTDGWYSADEATTEFAPVIVEIEASLNGKPLSARVVYSPSVDVAVSWGLFGNKAKGEAALYEAMRKAHAKLIEQIPQP